MKFIVAATACIALAQAKPHSGDGKSDVTDHAPLKHHGAPTGAGSWAAVDAAFFEANPEFAAYNFATAENGAMDIDAEGAFTYPDGNGTDGKYVAYTCGGESDPGLYWGKWETTDGTVAGDVGVFWELEDGTVVWSWADSTGAAGVNTAEKGTESKCGFKKAVTTETSTAADTTGTETATVEPTSAEVEVAESTTTEAEVVPTSTEVAAATTEEAATTDAETTTA